MIKISYLRLLQGEEYPCSLLASIACKHRHTLALSLFLSCFVVHPFCLPAVLLGGQPRHWGVELGFCPVCVQRTPQSTFLSGDVGWRLRRLVSHPIFCPPVVWLFLRLISGITSVCGQLSATTVSLICSCGVGQTSFSGQTT